MTTLALLTPAGQSWAYPEPEARERIVTVSPDGAPGNSGSGSPVVSANGRYMVFKSLATNLVSEPPAHGNQAYYMTNLETGDTTHLPIPVPEEVYEAYRGAIPYAMWAVDPNGGHAVFTTEFALVPEDENKGIDVYLFDRQAGEVRWVSVAPNGRSGTGEHAGLVEAVFAADGKTLFWINEGDILPGDSNRHRDIYTYDVASRTLGMVDLGGSVKVYQVSADGRYIAFSTNDPAITQAGGSRWHVYRHDRTTGTNLPVDVLPDGSLASNTCSYFDMTPDGRFVTVAGPVNLARHGGGGGMFVRDLAIGRTEKVSVLSDGSELYPPANYSDACHLSTISDDGRFVYFYYTSVDIEPTIKAYFLRDRLLGTTKRFEWPGAGIPMPSVRDTLVFPVVGGAGQIAIRPLVGSGTRIVSLDAAWSGEDIVLSGSTHLPGAQIAERADPVDGLSVGPVTASAMGGEILHGRVAARLQREDLLFHVDLAPRLCPNSWLCGDNLGSLFHTVSFDVGQRRFRVVAACVQFCSSWPVGFPDIGLGVPDGWPAQPPKGSFTLSECDPGCEPIGEVTGAIRGTGDSFDVAVPFDLIGAASGSSLRAVTFGTRLVAQTADEVAVDSVGLPDAVVPEPWVGVAWGDAVPAGKAFTEIETVEGRFGGTFALEQDPSRVWVRACVSDSCDVVSARIGGG